MPKGDADRIRRYLRGEVQAKRRAGAERISLRAQDIHESLGLTNAYPNVCQVLTSKKFHSKARVEFVRYVSRPPSGQGSSIVIEFCLLP